MHLLLLNIQKLIANIRNHQPISLYPVFTNPPVSRLRLCVVSELLDRKAKVTMVPWIAIASSTWQDAVICCFVYAARRPWSGRAACGRGCELPHTRGRKHFHTVMQWEGERKITKCDAFLCQIRSHRWGWVAWLNCLFLPLAETGYEVMSSADMNVLSRPICQGLGNN